MSDDKNHIDRLTPDLIEQYLKGELSHADMHSVEKLMLDSDFEAEAMEGFESINPSDIKSDLHLLHDKINKRTDSRSKRVSLFLKIAASVLFLAVSTFIAIQFIDEPLNTEQLSQAEKTAPEVKTEVDAERTEPEPLSEGGEEKQSKDEEQPLEKTETPAPQEILSLNEPEADKNVASTAEASSEEEMTEETFVEPEQARTMADVKDDADIKLNKTKDALEPALAKKIMPARRLAAEPNQGAAATKDDKVVSGQVTSAEDAAPLPGINVIVKGTNTGTVTDIDGTYKIALPDDSDSLIFSFIGMASRSVDVSGLKSVDVALESEVQQLSEVVVTALGEEDTYESTFTPSKPSVGKSEYKIYLENKIRYPNSESKKGRVVIKFTVKADGSLSNFVVAKSMGKKFDQEAIRLIKEGPDWTPARRDNVAVEDTVRVKVKFDPDN